MKRSTLRLLVALFALLTGLMHLGLGINFFADTLGKLFVLNGLGYLALLAAFWLGIPKGQSRLVHLALMAFAGVTIVAYFVVNGDPFGSIPGLVNKVIELALIVVTALHLRS